jgi:serine/threonine protein kinase
MDPEAWRTVEVLFHAALERAPEARQAFLDFSCSSDADLRRKVALLLAKHDDAGSFLETPPLQDMNVTGKLTEVIPGGQFGPYRILSRLGAGGMGEVFRAQDTKLGRQVAIKTLANEFARDPLRIARFRREARTLAALNHPHIAAIYGLEECGEVDGLILELVEGETLHGPLPIERALEYGRQVADALEGAHEKGFIHRDLKPANIKVTPPGWVKVLDFGLAKAIWGTERNPDLSQPAVMMELPTLAGHMVGTPSYMSPEQVRGKDVDHRADIWAFGCLLYELLTGRCGFEGETTPDTIAAVLEHEPDWQALPAETPAKIRELLRQCLQKDVSRRLNSIADSRAVIEEVQREWNRRSVGQVVRPRLAISAAAILILLGFFGVRLYQHYSRLRWIREQVIPEVNRLVSSHQNSAAFRLLRRAEKILPNDPALRQLHQSVSFTTTFYTNPPGAEVWATEYAAQDDWLRLGKTPFTAKELPLGYYRFRIVKPGFRSILAAGGSVGPPLEFDLDASNAIPEDMVRVPGGTVSIAGLADAKLGSFLIDRYEVTNRQFKRFIDSGGYRKPEYWKQEFTQKGRKLSREEAMQRLRDSTGRPGPSTWEFGEYPEGHDDYPVNGVSWYEAAAYADFVGKQLPTIYHWQQAASPSYYYDMAALSNFGGSGPAPVGSFKGLGAFGTVDMAGNVKEWCWNQTGGRRYIRGGAWNEPAYMFAALDARDPSDRSPQNGIRCVRYDARADSGKEAPVTTRIRDYNKDQPVPDSVFQLYRSLYAYDPSPLDARVEGIDEENAYWKREKVSFAAAYGNERVPCYLYLPKHATPPYQTILYVSPTMALWYSSPQPEEERLFEVVMRSGRAFLLPVLKGHYQRRYDSPPAGPYEARERQILESKDFRRAIDYLVSRPDVDRERLAALGISRGVVLARLAVGEQRLKAAALLGSGFMFDRNQLPEADPFNFVPHFRVPTLVVDGRFDFIFPLEATVRPMFRLLGTPNRDKQLLLWDGGHVPPEGYSPEKEALGWFDRYLGPVK